MRIRSHLLFMFGIVLLFCTPLSIISSIGFGEDITGESSGISTSVKNMEQELSNMHLTEPLIPENFSLPFGGFIENQGQVSDEAIHFYYSQSGNSVGFGDSKIFFIGENVEFSLSFTESNKVKPRGVSKKTHVVNYLYSEFQKTNIPTYDEIWFYNLYNGIDLRYFMSDKGLKYEFIVHPRANPSQISIEVSESIDFEIDDESVLFYSTAGLIFQDTGLRVFQKDGTSIDARFSKFDSRRYRFDIGFYDASIELIIDPWFLPFSTFMGGSSYENVIGTAVDEDDYIYVTGWAPSFDFPLKNPMNATYSGGSAAFFAKIDPNGNLVFSSYFDGSSSGRGIAVGTGGEFYISGITSYYNLPVKNAYNDTYSGSDDCYIAKINSTGNGILWCTYLGGENKEDADGIHLDSSENVYITGDTQSSDFPTENAYDNSLDGTYDAFVTSFTSSGAIRFSTYLGGSASDYGNGIGVDDEGLIYVAGTTTSTDFPNDNAYQSTHGTGTWDCFVTRFEANGNTINYSTYIGNDGYDGCNDITVFSNGSCVITGSTSNSNYPTINAYQSSYGGGSYDAIVTMLNPAGDDLVFSTFLGDIGSDYGDAITISPLGKIHVFGRTYSPNFPMVNAYNSTYGGNSDFFVSKFNIQGNDLEFSTFMGTDSNDQPCDIVIDSKESIIIVGRTRSASYPTIRAFDATYVGAEEGVITKFTFDFGPPEITLNNPANGSTIQPGMTIDLDITDDYDIETVLYNWDGSDNSTLNSPFHITAPSAPSDIDRILHVYVKDLVGYSAYKSYRFVYSTLWTPFSTFLVGSEIDFAYDIKVDNEGYIYIVGGTNSTDFNITAGAYNETNNGDYDIFLSKFSPSGVLLYSTYLGGSGGDYAMAMDFDILGNIILTGLTDSIDFPTTQDAVNRTHSGSSDVIIVRFNMTDGTLLYSSYFGGSSADYGTEICMDSSGYAHIIGTTSSDNLPTNSTAAQPSHGGGFMDAFVFKISVISYNLAFCTYLGGDGIDEGNGIDLGQLGRVVVTGRTFSTDFPIYSYYQTDQPSSDVFVTWLSSNGGLINSTYLGGNSDETAFDIYADPTSDNAIIVGWTMSTNFPLVNPLQSYGGGYGDAFITFMVGPDSVALSSYIGGSGNDQANAIHINSTSWDAYIVGTTQSIDFPLENALYSNFNGVIDIFVMALDNIATTPVQLLFSTYIGGSSYDYGTGIAFDKNDNVYITGESESYDYPVYNAFEDEYNSEEEVIVTKFCIDEISPEISVESPTPGSVLRSGSIINLTVMDDGIGISHVFANWDGAQNQSLIYPYQIPLVSGDGAHTLKVYSNDSFGNWAGSASYIFTTDDSSPEIYLGWPGNETVQKAGTVGELDFTEPHLDSVLIRWDSDEYTPIESPHNFIFPFGDGMHTLHVIVNDTVGNSEYAKFVFYIDDTFPEITLQYPGNNTAHHSNSIIEVDVYDLHLEQVLYHWDKAMSNSSWEEPYETFLPALEIVHKLFVYASDSVGNWNYVIFTFITDETLPGLSHPSDIAMAEGDLGESIIWTPISPDPSTYTILSNGSEVNSSTWTSGIPIEYSLSGYAYGLYKITIIITDGSSNIERDWVWVNVFDDTAPVISHPDDLIYEENTIVSQTIIWNGTDLNPAAYQVFRNDTVYTSGLWNASSDFFVIDVDGLSRGVHEFKMIIIDVDGNNASDIVYATVIDLTPPAIEKLDYFAYVVGTIGHELVWIVIDKNPASYDVYRNGSLLGSFGWDGYPISVNIDGLGLGTYNYTIRVFDIDNNQAADTVWVFVVVDETPPVIDNPPDTYYQVGTIGNNLTWTPDDEFPSHYEIFRNGTSIEEDNWDPEDENITISIDGLDEGVYNFTIIVFDDGGNNATQTIWVEVVNDTITPTIDQPDDISYNEGTSGHEIIWTPNDAYPSNYSIFRNGVEIKSGNWNGSVIAISIDSLAAGQYNYTITAFDIGNNMVSDTVWVSVVDVTSPEINSPSDFSYAEGFTGNSIEWTPIDLHPDTYSILCNDSEIKSNEWTGDSIFISIDGLPLGIYNYTIIVLDESGNSAKDTVLVTVYDGTPPILDSPADIEYEEGDTGNSITWTPNDEHPEFYEIYMDGTLLYSDNWGGSVIIVSVDGLVAGTYNFTLIVEDIGGNTAVDTVMVSVTPASTSTPTTTTGPTTTTTPTGGVDIIIIIAIVGVGGIILVLVVYVCKKRQR